MEETQYNRRNSSVYRLRSLGNNKYQVHKNSGPAFEGTRKLILRAAVEMGINAADFRYAIKEMRKYGHDYADFGVYGRFLYTQSDRKTA